jgi:anti-sigma B factor antagonist
VSSTPDSGIERIDRDGDRAVLWLRGELDLAQRIEVLTAVSSLVAEGVTNLAVDLSEVTFMDSSGLSALLEARRLGATLSLRNPSERVRQLLDVVVVGGLIAIETD